MQRRRLYVFILPLLGLANGLSGEAKAYDATISSSGNGGPILVTASGGRFAGAISSITYRGVQYIDTVDHGREMQTALQVDDLGECNNPTEAGSLDDAARQTTTSVLNAISNSNNILSTATTPAYWLAPGEYAPNGCGGSPATTGQNSALLSNYGFSRVTQVSPYSRNLFDATMTITVPENRSSTNVEALTAYLPASFANWLAFDPASRTLVKLSGTSSAQLSAWPLIVSQSNGANAMGVISPGIYSPNLTDGASMGEYYAFFSFGGASPTAKWSCVYGHGPIAPGTQLTYDCLFAIGSVDEIIASFEAYPMPGVTPSAMVPIFRFYGNQKHFMTLSYDEGAGAGMTFETTGFHLFPAAGSGYHAIYRCFNPRGGDHYLSTDSNCEGFNIEGIIGYALDSQAAGTVPLYRFYYPRTADHLITVNYNEGYRYNYEGVLGYVTN